MGREMENSSEGSEDFGGRGGACKDVNPNPENVNLKPLVPVPSTSGTTVQPPEQRESIRTEKQKCATKDTQVNTELQKRARQECSKFGVGIDDYDEELLKSITLGGEVNRPLLEVTVLLGVIPKLTEETLRYLDSHNVVINRDDQKLLEQVTILQVRAKVAKARASTEVLQTVNSLPMDKIVKHLSQVIRSHKLLIDQLGVVEHERQLIVPRLQVGPNLAIDINDVIDKYENFINRVRKHLRNAIDELDFDNAKGSMAQLVGSEIDIEISEERKSENFGKKTWCYKNVPIAVLALGGGLELGFESRDLLHNEKIKCVEWILDTDDFLSMVQGRNGGKLIW